MIHRKYIEAVNDAAISPTSSVMVHGMHHRVVAMIEDVTVSLSIYPFENSFLIYQNTSFIIFKTTLS